ncbi:MAG: hypothetical protein A2Y17_11615 [Clostridiales bacterium GWF2_38_85]|nr:MAG: hypothetical protein A2Y17_11615 [Clostridiales bacterium GWF2_38_85]HBL85349.1 DUF1292 domain-containing protein [Clostridiales bacterium]
MPNKDEIFENELFTLTDEEGNESQFEMLGSIELDGKNYVALVPTEGDQDEYVILKLEYDENDGEVLVTIDDDEEFDKVADEFEDAFMGEFDCDENGFSVEDDEEDSDEEDEQDEE